MQLLWQTMNMQFSNTVNNNNINMMNYNYVPNNMLFSKKIIANRNVVAPPPIPPTNSAVKPDDEVQPDVQSKSRWGPSTWFLFHTLAQKIRPEEFHSVGTELLDMIKTICKNLPCPTCAQHATEYIQRLDYNLIKSKDDLKQYLFKFHNDVNSRRARQLFSMDELELKYAAANTVNVIKNFIAVFQYRSGSFNMIANDMQRQRQTDLIKMWFNNNVQRFEP